MTPASPPADGATVRLHRALYMNAAIGEAATTFAEFATFSVRTESEHYVVAITDIDREVDGDVVAEFCNFALANTAIRRKNAHA